LLKEPAVHDDRLPLLVAAYGNALAADDAFGPLVAEVVQAMALAGVEVVTLGMQPAGLLNHMAGRRAVCVVDAAWCAGLKPGTLIEGDFFAVDRPTLAHDAALSTHGLSVADELDLARRLEMCPRHVWLVAVVAASVEVGRAPSDNVTQQVPAAAERVAHWAARFSEPEN
jgi:hydrogenase maturation protease